MEPIKAISHKHDVQIQISFAEAGLKPKYKALIDKIEQMVRRETGINCEYKPDGGGAPAIIEFSAKK